MKKPKAQILLELLESMEKDKAEQIRSSYREAIEERRKKIDPSKFSKRPVKVS